MSYLYKQVHLDKSGVLNDFFWIIECKNLPENLLTDLSHNRYEAANLEIYTKAYLWLFLKLNKRQSFSHKL